MIPTPYASSKWDHGCGFRIGRSQDAAAATPRVLQAPRDPGMGAIVRPGDQAAVMYSVRLGIGALVEQELHRFQVPFPYGEVYPACPSTPRGSRPGSRSTNGRPLDIAVPGPGERGPDEAALLRTRFGPLDHLAKDSPGLPARHLAHNVLRVEAQIQAPGLELQRDGLVPAEEARQLGTRSRASTLQQITAGGLADGKCSLPVVTTAAIGFRGWWYRDCRAFGSGRWWYRGRRAVG